MTCQNSVVAARNSTPRRRTQQERTAESTQRLITAAIELIAEKGIARTSAAEISERAGYSRSMVQFRYGSKELLLETLLREEYETRLLLGDSDQYPSGLERVLAQIDRLHDEAVANPELMRGFFVLCFEAIGPVPSLNTWINDWLDRYHASTAAALDSGRDDGSIRSDIDPKTESEAFVASGLGYAFRWMVGPQLVDYPALMRQWREQLRAHLAVS
jgi:AcrR family transcriptional regulator